MARQRIRIVDRFEWRQKGWRCVLAAGAVALTLGLGPAYGDTIKTAHDGGQGRDKEHSADVAPERPHAEPSARITVTANAKGAGKAAAGVAQPKPQAATPPATVSNASAPKATVEVAAEEEGDATRSWTRTVTRTVASARGIIRSITRSWSYAIDEDGNRAVAKAVAKARAPSDVAAVENGAGRVVARTSVDVTGNGSGRADAGGSVGVVDGKVEVSTWGRTTAEVF